MKTKRAGRPRKAGKRKPCGRLQTQDDTGTPELLAHRTIAIHPEFGAKMLDSARYEENIAQLANHKSATDRRAAYPLGVFFAQHHVTSEQHYAGRRYLGLFVRAVCQPLSVPSVLGKMVANAPGTVPGMSRTDDEIAKAAVEARQSYLDCRTVLKALGRGVSATVDGVVVYEEHRYRPDQLVMLRKGLDALYAHFEKADAQKRAVAA